MIYKNRKYKCGICGTVSTHGTNHIGEIYARCKNCDNSTLCCIEDEAILAKKELLTDKAIIKFYNFDISKSGEYRDYKILNEALYKKGFRVWEDVAPYNTCKFTIKWKGIKKLDNKEINIYNKKQFNNQYVSEGFRAFDWCECVFDNRNIKKGYYLQHIEGV